MSSTKGSRKCYSCGKMASKPYTFTVVPPTGVYGKQKVYIKSEVKTKRADLRGNKKVFIYQIVDKKGVNQREFTINGFETINIDNNEVPYFRPSVGTRALQATGGWP